jgi:hypothetical protein
VQRLPTFPPSPSLSRLTLTRNHPPILPPTLPLSRSIPTIIRSAGNVLGFNTIAHAFDANGPLPAGAEQHCKVQSILVLYGLPRLLCGSIVAHELTHAWVRRPKRGSGVTRPAGNRQGARRLPVWLQG